MATSAAPYGLRLAKMIGNRSCSGSTNLYRIESGETDVFYFGQPVQYSSGYIVNCSAGNLGTTSAPDEYVGVFVGCEYTDPTSGHKVWRHYYPGSVTASDIKAYVIDDPTAIFMVQANAASFDALAAIGSCYALSSATTGSAVTQNSTIALDTDGSPSAGATLPFKVVDIAALPDNTNASGYVDVLVTINAGFHIFERNG